MTQAEQIRGMAGHRGVEILSREADRNCQEMLYLRRLDKTIFKFGDGSQIIITGRKVTTK